jgi:predicted nucleotide-binding protein
LRCRGGHRAAPAIQEDLSKPAARPSSVSQKPICYSVYMAGNAGGGSSGGAAELEQVQYFLQSLEEQDTLVNEGMKTRSAFEVSMPQLTTIKGIFDDILKYDPSLIRPFHAHADAGGLRSQLREARLKVLNRFNKLAFGGEIKETVEPSKTSENFMMDAKDKKKVFVVHGRNLQARKAIFEFLRAISLEPIEWEQAIALTASTSSSTLSAIQRAFENAQAAVVILTGDDLARLGKRYLATNDDAHERELTRQARPNVIFEAGMAFGLFPQRTIIVTFGKTRPISDIGGINILHLSDTAESRQNLSGRLTNAACDVNTANKSDWLSAGDFAAALHEDPDHGDSDPRAGLRISHRRASPADDAKFKPRVWVELRNDNDLCIELRHLGWTPTPNGIQIKNGFQAMQIKLGNQWCPTDWGLESLYVPPSGLIQTWVQPSEKHSMEDLTERCLGEGRIGILNVRVNGHTVHIEV